MHRRSERYVLDMAIELFVGADSTRARIADLSRTGMFVEQAPPLPIGTETHVAMFFEGRQLVAAATVVHGLDDLAARPLGRRPGNGLVFAPATRHADTLFLRAVDRLIAVRSGTQRGRVILRGELAGIGLPALLGMLEQERKTCRVVLGGPYTAWIDLVGGGVVAAGANGRAADPHATVMALLDWTGGEFELVATEPTAHGLRVSVTHLLLEHARRADEQARLGRN